MSIKHGLAGPLAVVALVAAGTHTGVASGVTADQEQSKAKRYCRSNNHGSYVCFQPYGDKFYVRDTASDGYSAVVRWRTSYGREEECAAVHGKGDEITCNYNLQEGQTVTFWAVNVDSPTNTYRFWSTERSTTI